MRSASRQARGTKKRRFLRRAVLPAAVALLLASGGVAAYLLTLDTVGETFDAVRQGDERKLKILLAVLPGLVNDATTGETPLHAAVRHGRSEMASLLLARGANPNARTQRGRTPLHHALDNNNVHMAELLLRHGADVNAADEKGQTPLQCAINTGNREMAEVLLHHGADAQARGSDRRTALEQEWTDDSHWLVRRLLERDCPADPAFLAPALSLALRHGYRQEVATYLRGYTDINRRSNEKSANGATLLHAATRLNDRQLVELLVSCGAGVSSTDSRRPRPWTPLDVAVDADRESPEFMRFLLDNRAQESVQGLHRALAAALEKTKEDLDRLEIVKFLLARHADAQAEHLYRALDIALEQGEKTLVRAYLIRLVNIDRKRDRSGKTLLHLAICSGNVAAVKLFLRHGADIRSWDWQGHTPLHMALTAPHSAEELTALLLATGADPNVEDLYERTPLHTAIMGRARPGVIKLLLDAGTNVRARCIDNYTPLLRAAAAGNIEYCKLLLAYHANINETDRNRQTPLHYAAKLGYTKLARFLLDNGAYYRQKDNSGARPIRLAIRNGHGEIVEMLHQEYERRARGKK